MKKIYDSLHGFIRLGEVEQRLIETKPFQRLHYITQLGVAYLVYPGAQHKRYEHSLGVMHLATLMYDRIIERGGEGVPEVGSREHGYWRLVLRLAALCHDLGHLPFSHTAESAMLGDGGHEAWTEKICRSHYLDGIWENDQMREDVIDVALGRCKDGFSQIVTELITGDFLGADRIDYLLRDARGTGVAYGLFDYQQLIEMLCIVRDERGEMCLGIEENGIESCEALLLARHFMYRRVYQYDSVKACAFHLSEFMKERFQGALASVDTFIDVRDSEVLATIFAASKEGDRHAEALTNPKKRCRAYPFTGEAILRLCQEKKVPIHFEQKKEGSAVRLDLPVVREDGQVVNAKDLSSISIPFPKKNWIYVAQSHAPLLRQLLGEHEKVT